MAVTHFELTEQSVRENIGLIVDLQLLRKKGPETKNRNIG